MIRLLFISIALIGQSCALLTSYKNFTIKANDGNAFKETASYADASNYSLILFNDGSVLLAKAFGEDEVEPYLKKIHYDIYEKWRSDSWFHWGVYEIKGDSINMEFIEKTDQLGFMRVCNWRATSKDWNQEIRILPGPTNRKIKEVNYYPLPNTAVSLTKTAKLNNLEIDSKKAWINR
jgi:hypothetical protein